MITGWELLARSGIDYAKFEVGSVQIDGEIRRVDSLAGFRDALERMTFAEIGETELPPARCSFAFWTADVMWQTDPDLEFGLIYPTSRTPEYWVHVRRKQWQDHVLGDYFEASKDLAAAMARDVHIRAEASNILRRFVRVFVRLDVTRYGYLRKAARTLDPGDLRELAREVLNDHDRRRSEGPDPVVEIRGLAKAVIGYGGADAVRRDADARLVEMVNGIGWGP